MENKQVMEVKKVCRQQIEGMMTKNVDLLDQIIKSDADFIHITGEHQTKAEWIRQIKIGRMTYFNSQELNLDAGVTGNNAIVHMSNSIDARIYGFRNIWSLKAEIKLLKEKDQWKIFESRASLGGCNDQKKFNNSNDSFTNR